MDLSLVGNNDSVIYTDNGMSGDTVDPTELLYKGGEPIIAQTIEQKDNTLFLGNIKLARPQLEDVNLKYTAGIIGLGTRSFTATTITGSGSSYPYYNQLTSKSGSRSVPCAGFKYGDYYRLGVQFQHESGRWSDPLFINDIQVSSYNPSASTNTVTVPVFTGTLNSTILNSIDASYRKVRAIAVFPNMQDRMVICQGVANPTLFTSTARYTDKNLHAQASWFFRPKCNTYTTGTNGIQVSPISSGYLMYTNRNIEPGIPDSGAAYDPSSIRRVEIQGDFGGSNSPSKFQVDWGIVTLHSPDIEFDDTLATTEFTSLKYRDAGRVSFSSTMSDIDIQTETPVVKNASGGFVHKAFTTNGPWGIVGGLFYDDWLLNDRKGGDGNLFVEPLDEQRASAKFMIYPWQKGGALNNDMNRPSDKGTQTSTLKKKIISNLRYADTTTWDFGSSTSMSNPPQLFSSDQVTIVKLGSNIYQGNIDTSIIPDNADGVYFAWVGGIEGTAATSFTENNNWWKLFSKDMDKDSNAGLKKYQNDQGTMKWKEEGGGLIGDEYIDLVMKKEAVRMKYKSTPHIVMNYTASSYDSLSNSNCLPVVELVRPSKPTNIFGGDSDDALKANIWIPCGEPVSLYDDNNTRKSSVTFEWSYGDTYFQRYDCLKTYPFTREDPNQIVEIGSFMLETHTNIDGRYDRNRGQASNFNMSPTNFNLLNPVYSQVNNFFTYRIMDSSFYENSLFPNQITWTKEKQSGADVDLWTNITLGSVYDMDGSKGEVVSINAWKDQLYCFQTKGVSNILFNSRVQIPASDGVPIEISNSYKVDGYRYISDGIGCNARAQIKETTSGIYFIDSVSGHLHHIGDALRDIAATNNMTTWFRANGKQVKKLLYDDINHDLYCIQEQENNVEKPALCFSELLSQFTGFMDYDDISLIETCNHRVFTMKDSRLFGMFEGNYCDFFGTWNNNVYTPTNKSWGLTFVSNGSSEAMTDKIFTNLEFRASVDGEGAEVPIAQEQTQQEEEEETSTRYEHFLPFDYLEAWDEHQHGYTTLENKNGHSAMVHGDTSNSLKRKFRIWRCDIPRNNCLLDDDHAAYDETEGNTPLPYSYDSSLGISRHFRRTVDRMRNPWLFVKIQKDAERSMHRTELHDISVIYYN